MKRIKYIFILLSVLCLSGCNILDLSPVDNYSMRNYWNSKEQCDRFMIGLQNRVRMRITNMLLMGEMRGGTFNTSNITTIGQTASSYDIINNNLSITSPGITNWGTFYLDIMQINHAIESLETPKDFLTEDQQNYYRGQLYGLRAFYYFHLLRTWGGVPLVDKAEVLKGVEIYKLSKERSTERETMAFIKRDIERSVEAFSNDKFTKPQGVCFWTKAATYCLRGEIYLWSAKVHPISENVVFSTDVQKDLNMARESLESVSDLYSLLPDFSKAISSDDNAEQIYTVRYLYGEATNWYGQFTYAVNLFNGFFDENNQLLSDPFRINGGMMRYEYKLDNYLSFSDNDQRKRKTFFYYKSKDASIQGIFLIKFLGEIRDNIRYFTDDIAVWRYADVCLMLAEVYNELGDVAKLKDYLERVRFRAYGSSYPPFNFTDKQSAESEILNERIKEFYGEGKTWYDKRRMLGGSFALQLVQNDERKLLWPIDIDVLTKDRLVEQNPGY